MRLWPVPVGIRVVLVALVAVASLLPVERAAAQELPGDRISIRLVVNGTAPSGFTIAWNCLPSEGVPAPAPPNAPTLSFDAAGHPTTSFLWPPENTPTIVDDAWVLEPQVSPPGEVAYCRLSQLPDPAPDALSWTCLSTVTPDPPAANPDLNAPTRFGCQTAAGGQADPLLFTIFDAPTADPPQNYSQTVDATFTNTFAPQPITIAPVFTG